MQTPVRRTIAVVALLAVPVGLLGCGGDDGDGDDPVVELPTTAPGTDGAASTTSTAAGGADETTSTTRPPRDIQTTSTDGMATTTVTEASQATLGVASTTTPR